MISGELLATYKTQQPSKLKVAGSNPAGVAKYHLKMHMFIDDALSPALALSIESAPCRHGFGGWSPHVNSATSDETKRWDSFFQNMSTAQSRLQSTGSKGIVSKRRGLPYRSGRCKAWVKVKNPASPAALRIEDGTW